MTTRTSSPGCDRSRYLGVMQNSIFMMMANHGGGKLTVSALGFLSAGCGLGLDPERWLYEFARLAEMHLILPQQTWFPAVGTQFGRGVGRLRYSTFW